MNLKKIGLVIGVGFGLAACDTTTDMTDQSGAPEMADSTMHSGDALMDDTMKVGDAMMDNTTQADDLPTG